MTLQNLWDDFKERFYNHEIPFSDTATWDWATTTYQLSQAPISSHSPYIPVITVNAVSQTEGTHYTVNYELWVVTFVTAPTNLHAIVISAHHQKCNLSQFIKYYNRSANKLKVSFAIEWIREVKYTDVSWATADDTIERIDTTVAPFNTYEDIYEIYQYENDWRSVQFTKRANVLLLTLNTNLSGFLNTRVGLHSDYLGSRLWRTESQFSGLRYPYFISWNKKYTEITTTWTTALNTSIEFVKDWLEQTLLLIGVFMYLSMQEWLLKNRAVSPRTVELQQINIMLMWLNAQLFSDLKFSWLWKWQQPITINKFSRTDIESNI